MASNITNLVTEAEAAGWTVTHTRGGHLRFTHPDGHVVYGSGTPSDQRSVRNVRA